MRHDYVVPGKHGSVLSGDQANYNKWLLEENWMTIVSAFGGVTDRGFASLKLCV